MFTSLEKLYLRISPDQFHFLKFILEGYDNLGLISSIDSKDGVVLVRYPEGYTRDIFQLLSEIAPRLSKFR